MQVLLPVISHRAQILTGVAIAIALVLISAYLAIAAPLVQSATEGEAIYLQKCAACHTVGKGPLVGPDLLGVTERREENWLRQWIKEPDRVLASGDTLATQLVQEYNNLPMPNMGLTDSEVAAVLAFLAAQSGPIAAGEGAVAAVQPGNPADGRKLFAGEYSLINGGPPCMSCHHVEGVGGIGGGTLGPDLTDVYTRYEESGLAATLQTLPFPSMQGVFAGAPLTPAEQAALLGFFKEVDRSPPPATGGLLDLFTLIGVIGFVLLLFLSWLIWRDRFTGALKPLLGGKK